MKKWKMLMFCVVLFCRCSYCWIDWRVWVLDLHLWISIFLGFGISIDWSHHLCSFICATMNRIEST